MSITIRELIYESHSIAISKGWWDTHRGIPELLALVHSEVSEALEAYRIKGDTNLHDAWESETGKPEGFAFELADVLIRIADMCGKLELDLDSAIQKKMAFNQTRSYRHGQKKA